MRRALAICIVAAGLVCPALAFAQTPQSPPSVSQSAQDAVTVNQLMSIIAERDRQYSQRFDAQEKSTIVALAAAKEAVQAALIAAKEAVQKAETASEKRFDSVNEFRNTLKDQQSMLMLRVEAESRLKDLDRRVTDLTDVVSRRASEAKGASELWGLIAGIIGVGALIIGVVFGVVGLMSRRAKVV